MKINKFILLLLFSGLAFGQRTSGTIDPIAVEGMHQILLTPEIRSAANEDLSDFRIYDNKENEVPYFLAGRMIQVLKGFDDYPIVEKTSIPKKSTSYIIANSSSKRLSGISLTVGNSDGIKTYDLSGSNDKNQWFGISNKATIGDLNNNEQTESVKNITFPLSAYKYFKITFNDSLSLPINVLRAGTLRENVQIEKMIQVKTEKVATENLKSEKKTVIKIGFKNKQIINQIDFVIKSPKLFKRSAVIYKLSERKRKRKTETYKEILYHFTLLSDARTTIQNIHLFDSEFFIEIDNRDNPPLDISSINFSQLPVYVVAELSPNQKYTVKAGDRNLVAPDYDIASFSNINTANLPLATIVDVKPETVTAANKIAVPFWQQPWFMWFCIAVGGAAIAYFTVSLVRDLK